jgi:copper chaperone CopZ
MHMRYFIFLTFILGLLFFFGCKKGENTQTATISVKSMGCDNCVKIVRKAIFTLNGITDVEANLEKKLVYVKYLPKYTNIQSIEIVITRAGYDANDRPRDSLAFMDLPERCQNHN